MLINQKQKNILLVFSLLFTGLNSLDWVNAEDVSWANELIHSSQSELENNSISLAGNNHISPDNVFLTGCESSCCSRGTLFQWSGSDETGGPDLEEALVTDRPDFTEASSSVGCGVVQIEVGYTYVYDNSDDESTRTNSYGEPLLRIGIYDDWLELRIGVVPGTQRVKSPGSVEHDSGFSDLYLGFKIALTPQDGLLPEMAIIPQMFVPTGGDAFSFDHVAPGLNWIYSWEINDFISVAGSTQGNRRFDANNGSYLRMAQSGTIAYTLTEGLGAYTEWFALVPTGGDQTNDEHYFNGGFTYLINNDMQFDIRAGLGLNEAAADYFVGSGLSIRFH